MGNCIKTIIGLLVLAFSYACKQNTDKKSLVGFDLPAIETNSSVAYQYQFTGKIAKKYPIQMEITSRLDGSVVGRYKYTKHNDWLKITGSFIKPQLKLNYVASDTSGGGGKEVFDGLVSDNKITGTWKELIRKVTYEFEVYPNHNAPLISQHILIAKAKNENDYWRIFQIEIFSKNGILLQTIDKMAVKSADNTIYLQLINDDPYWDICFNANIEENKISNSFIFDSENKIYISKPIL